MYERGTDPVIDPIDAARQARQLIAVTRAIREGWKVDQKVIDESIQTARQCLTSEKDDVRLRAVDMFKQIAALNLKSVEVELRAIEIADKSRRLDEGKATENVTHQFKPLSF